MSTSSTAALRLAASGPLSVDEVWGRYTRPELWPTWAPHIRKVDYCEPVVTPGTTGRVKGVGGVVAHFRIDAVDEAARTWSWSVRSGPVRLSFEHGVDVAPPGSGEASTAWLVIHAAWPVAIGYAPIARLALGRLVRPGQDNSGRRRRPGSGWGRATRRALRTGFRGARASGE